MKKLFTLALLLCCTVGLMAQGTISGTLVDQEDNEPLIGASIYLKGSSLGTISDLDGNFSINNVPNGTYTMTVKYLGYTDYSTDINVAGSAVDLGSLKMNTSSVGLKAVEVIASLAVDRKTPVAVSTLRGEEIEEIIGNQEFPEVLRSTPSIYVTKQGGGFGDARINVRGFDQTNVAVMINGIPVNDMENGRVYWSNWAGLADVTSSMQVQRGLGASKLAVASVGGSINIVTNAADHKKGGAASITTGNDGYQKYGVVLSSGQRDNGFATTMQLTHTRGDGYADGTKFQAYSYFLSTSYKINENQTISGTVLGAPQWHHQRNGAERFDNVYLQTFRDEGIKFNHVWGELDGEEFTWRKNFYHKPKAFLNHYLNLGEKTSLKTSAYMSFGIGGGTGPRGRIDNDSTTIFDSFGGFGSGTHDENGQVRFDDLVGYNQGTVQFGGAFDTAPDTTSGSSSTGYRDGFVRRASMNLHSWYGVLSTLNTELSPSLDLTAGVDARYYKGEHYRRLENLLGNAAYVSGSDDNNPNNVINETSPAEFGNFLDRSYRDGNNVLNYHNDGLVSWAGVFAQLEYSQDDLTAFVSLSGSNQGFKRIDYFNYLDTDPAQETEWQNFFGGTAKLGANYNISETMNVFANAGYFSRQPTFDNVFLNFVNEINEDVKNQSVTSFELGWGFYDGNLDIDVNGYLTQWGNRQFSITDENAAGEDILYNFENVTQIHSGIELEAQYSPIRMLNLSAMASIGNWEYGGNFTASGTNTDTGSQEPDATIYGDGIKVGDAAQTTFNFRAELKPINGLKVYGNFFLADNLFAQFDIVDNFNEENPDQVVEVPSYNLVDAGASYNFDVNGVNITARVTVNNLLDTEYISEMFTSNRDNPDTADINEFYTTNRGFYGFGRTWSAGLKVKF